MNRGTTLQWKNIQERHSSFLVSVILRVWYKVFTDCVRTVRTSIWTEPTAVRTREGVNPKALNFKENDVSLVFFITFIDTSTRNAQ